MSDYMLFIHSSSDSYKILLLWVYILYAKVICTLGDLISVVYDDFKNLTTGKAFILYGH